MTSVAPRLSQRVIQLAPSQTFALADKAKKLKAAGRPVISFSVGEPDFTSPKVVCDAAKAAIDAGKTHYTPVRGTAELVEGIQTWVARECGGYEATEKQILVSNGGKQSLYNLFQALLDPGDEVVIPSPYWVSYPAQIQLAGGRAIPIPCNAEDGFRLDPRAVETAIGPRCKALLLNSPSNPTGAVISPEDIEILVKIALDKGTLVISDEIYSGLLYDGAVHKSALSVDDPRVRENVILVNGVSKSYAMTGWRIGFAVGPEWVIGAAAKIQSQSTSGASSISQAAAVAALASGSAEIDGMREAFAKRRAVAVAALEEIPGVRVPEARGAFYLFPDFSAYYGSKLDGEEITGSASLSNLLLDKVDVAAVPGSAFGADAHLRLSYALDEASIREGIGRVRDLLAKAEPQPAS